ncbi:MAG TPA: c-type cytochrome [Burkholderiales bacterium]|nr:c-type cytochrome [Burkholderiales bacterium]
MRRFDTARRMGAICRCVGFACAAVLAAATCYAQPKIDPSRGAAKAAACASCHGSPQRPPLAGMPTLAGQQEQFLVLQMFLMREGLRDVPQMAGTLKDFSDRDLDEVAAYFSRQTPAQSGTSAKPKLRARGAALAKSMACGSCHLADYTGQRQVPRLANQREDYMAATMKAYRDNKRVGTDTGMNGILYQVPDSDIDALAHYLAYQ